MNFSKQTSTQPPPLHMTSVMTNGAEGLLTLLFNLSGNPCQSGYCGRTRDQKPNIPHYLCHNLPAPYPALDKAHRESSGLDPAGARGPSLFQVLFGSRDQIRRCISPIFRLEKYVQSPGFLVTEKLRRSRFFLSQIQVFRLWGVKQAV